MKWKRLFAIAGLVLILAMYLIAIVSAFLNTPQSKNWLMAAIFSTVIVPVFLYAAQLVYRLLKPEDKSKEHPKHDI